MARKATKGKCVFCNKEFAKTGMGRHLDNHLSEIPVNNKPGKSFLIKIEPNRRWGASPYFLYLWVDGKAEMDDIDSFLRSIWLECCGHMSGFTIKRAKRENAGTRIDAFELLLNGRVEEYEQLMEEENGEILMDKKAKDVLAKGLQLDYSYDYGSTTQLELTIMEEYPAKAKDPVVLLSRNERPELICHICNTNQATQLCTECINYKDEYAFCKKCAKKHAKSCSNFSEYSSVQVVNSPRMGVCGYNGGKIDKDRD